METLDAELQRLTSRTRSVEESVQRDAELLQQLDDFLQVHRCFQGSIQLLYSSKKVLTSHCHVCVLPLSRPPRLFARCVAGGSS